MISWMKSRKKQTQVYKLFIYHFVYVAGSKVYSVYVKVYKHWYVIFSVRQKLKKLEVANDEAEKAQQFSQAEMRMRKTQQVCGIMTS